MATPVSISASATPLLACPTKSSLSLTPPSLLHRRNRISVACKPYSSSLLFHPLRVVVVGKKRLMWGDRKGCGAVCYSAPLTTLSIQWICSISIGGDYGLWTAFLALFVRLFFSFPGELELPLAAFLVVAVAPYEFMRFRGTKESAVLCLVVAGYLAFKHFSRIGSLKKAFDQGSIVATLSVICITVMSFLMLV